MKTRASTKKRQNCWKRRLASLTICAFTKGVGYESHIPVRGGLGITTTATTPRWVLISSLSTP